MPEDKEEYVTEELQEHSRRVIPASRKSERDGKPEIPQRVSDPEIAGTQNQGSRSQSSSSGDSSQDD
jgi:hypothetical protein